MNVDLIQHSTPLQSDYVTFIGLRYIFNYSVCFLR